MTLRYVLVSSGESFLIEHCIYKQANSEKLTGHYSLGSTNHVHATSIHQKSIYPTPLNLLPKPLSYMDHGVSSPIL